MQFLKVSIHQLGSSSCAAGGCRTSSWESPGAWSQRELRDRAQSQSLQKGRNSINPRIFSITKRGYSLLQTSEQHYFQEHTVPGDCLWCTRNKGLIQEISQSLGLKPGQLHKPGPRTSALENAKDRTLLVLFLFSLLHYFFSERRETFQNQHPFACIWQVCKSSHEYIFNIFTVMKQENIQRGIKKMEEKTHIIPLLLEEKKMLLFVIIPSELFWTVYRAWQMLFYGILFFNQVSCYSHIFILLPWEILQHGRDPFTWVYIKITSMFLNQISPAYPILFLSRSLSHQHISCSPVSFRQQQYMWLWWKLI